MPEIKKLNSDYKDIHSTTSQNILKSLDQTYQNFFRRVKSGTDKVGFPRFRSRNRFKSFKYVQSGFRVDGNKLHLSKIGSCRIKLTRNIIGVVKTCTLVKRIDKWYAVFTVERNFEPLPESNLKIGIDAGLEKLLTLSNSEYVPNERFFEQSQKKLANAQRKLALRKKFSNRWRKQCKLIAKIHQYIANRRKDSLHKLSTALVKAFGNIAVEDLNIDKLKSLGLGKSISDAAWNMLINFISYKAARAGRVFTKVDPAYTSQECLCGQIKAKCLSDRVHQCSCGITCDRDLMSSLIVEHRAFKTPLSNFKNRLGANLREFEFNH